ncbi:hypothetical protein E2986_11303 [Frieseomelitta varia]|uniref:Uncharacterized protein n=1 Tax=Frieseomelitta varia TaxID=561572 RepID=A0A833RSV6_9HYME|nr:hypothetical protein E2986_11303 [Frieseomelitta varia]
MTSFYDNYDYYKKMLELQEKLRKSSIKIKYEPIILKLRLLHMFINDCYSEEERIRLEERFKILVQESRNRRNWQIAVIIDFIFVLRNNNTIEFQRLCIDLEAT